MAEQQPIFSLKGPVMAEQQPIFSLKGPVMESAKALTMVSKVTIIIILPSYIIKGILDFQWVHLW